jgi:hypothetical protein
MKVTFEAAWQGAARLLDFVFGCHHRRLSRPVTSPAPKGAPPGETYVVCLDCGKHLAYDMQAMRLGKELK